MNWLEQLCERFLISRGRTVVPQVWSGFILSGPTSIATWKNTDGAYDIYFVEIPTTTKNFMALDGARIDMRPK